MKQSITNYDFHRAFEQLRPDNFSYEGLNALFEWLEDYEDQTGEQLELNVIALCCDFTEYETVEDLLEDYSTFDDLDEIKDNTLVIEFNNSVIIQVF
jgi:hypothetical protein